MGGKQRNKKVAKTDFEAPLQKCHATMRERRIRTGKDDRYDDKWRRFILNGDQSPLLFAVYSETTYELPEDEQHQNKVWISQPGSRLEKRQCALQVCFRPNSDQPRLGIIFLGTSKRISNDKKAAYQPDVDVFFQENVWADPTICVEWAERTPSKAVDEKDRFVVFGII